MNSKQSYCLGWPLCPNCSWPCFQHTTNSTSLLFQLFRPTGCNVHIVVPEYPTSLTGCLLAIWGCLAVRPLFQDTVRNSRPPDVLPGCAPSFQFSTSTGIVRQINSNKLSSTNWLSLQTMCLSILFRSSLSCCRSALLNWLYGISKTVYMSSAWFHNASGTSLGNWQCVLSVNPLQN